MNRKDTSLATGTYTCPMHPEVQQDKPGKCPKCGMALVQKSSDSAHAGKSQAGGKSCCG